MLTLEELKEKHDKAYTHNQTTREKSSDDLVFYHVTQWDDTVLGETDLAYRGQFDILRKAGRQIMGDLRANPVQVDFQPKSETREDAADLADGLYRSDDRVNTSIESYDNATGEAVVSGIGGWEMVTQYESNRAGDEKQVIRRKPIHEFNNNAYPDPNAKLLDKADAMYWSLLAPYSSDGYKKLVHELTGEEIDTINPTSFSSPQTSYVFPWITGQNEIIYVVRFYHKEKVNDTIYTFSDPFGDEIRLRKSDIKDIEDELIDEGYEIIGEKKIQRWQVTLYIASGEQILETYEIPCENIPVMPTYGERAFIEGEEHYEGVTRLAKDPQRLRNFQMSYLADIVSRSPRPKPIFYPEQLGQWKFMYEEGGAENNYPFYFQERKDAQGQDLPLGPVGQMPEQQMPQSLIASIGLSREAVSDVAPANITSEISDVDLSGKAVVEMQRRLDDQSIVYQQNLKHAKRYDAMVYAEMASVIYDTPRMVTLTLPDGTRKEVQIMEAVMDEDGEMVVINDLTNSEFEVFAEIGPNYSTKRDETFDKLGQMALELAQTDPAMSKALRLQQLTMMDGVQLEPVRDNARRELISIGYMEPETDDEKQMVLQAQQNQQPDPAMALAAAEQTKGDAAMMREETARFKAMNDAKNKDASTEIDRFKATTDRMDMQVEAEKAGAEINFKRAEAMTKRLESVTNQQFRARVNQ